MDGDMEGSCVECLERTAVCEWTSLGCRVSLMERP
jgi:hypothetical protein